MLLEVFGHGCPRMISTPFALKFPCLLGLSNASINQVQLALAVGGVAVVLLVMLRQRRKTTAQNKAQAKRVQSEINGQTLRDVEAVMAQLDQLSRQIHAKIDLKLATVQKLIRDADQRIEQLASVQRDGIAEPKLDISLEAESPDESTGGDADPYEAIYRLADSGYSPIQVAKKLGRHAGEIELILSLRRARLGPSLAAPTIRKQAG